MAAGPTVRQLLATYPGKIRLVIKNFPYKYRDFAKIAAKASLAAKEQDKYWEMHELLLSRSPRLDRDSLISYAGELGLDEKQFIESLDSTRHEEAIESDLKLAATLDLYNTPTFYINGRQVIGERPLEYFRKILDEELSEAGR